MHPCYLGAITANSLYIFNNQYRNVAEFAGSKSKGSWIFGQKYRRISQVNILTENFSLEMYQFYNNPRRISIKYAVKWFFYSGPLNKLHTTMSGKISAGQIFYDYVILVGLLDPLGQSIAAFAIDVWPNLIITVPISTIVLDSETGK